MAKTKPISVDIEARDYSALVRLAQFHERTLEQEVRWILKCELRGWTAKSREIAVIADDNDVGATD